MGFLLGYTRQKIEIFREKLLLKKMFLYVMLRLYTEIHCPTMPGTDQKFVWGYGRWVFKPIIMFSLVQAEQLSTDYRQTNTVNVFSDKYP